VSAILDDMDSRPGSTTSLLRTVIGLYMRRLGEWLPIADLIAIMEELDVPAPRTRTAVVRLKKKGVLVAETRDRGIGYTLEPGAFAMLEKGDRRIFAVRTMSDDDPWCLISFSVPEELRHLRHQLRRRLFWIGCGIVSPALWICPSFLSDEVEDILDELQIRQYAVLFRTERPQVATDLRTAITDWWDLDELEAQHRAFIAETLPLVATDASSDADAFARYIRGVDNWRLIPYLDPGLPWSLMPDNWPGQESIRLWQELSDRFADGAWRYVSGYGTATP
jgi:phenylacetic acid degradation operon negative regulatory protein